MAVLSTPDSPPVLQPEPIGTGLTWNWTPPQPQPHNDTRDMWMCLRTSETYYTSERPTTMTRSAPLHPITFRNGSSRPPNYKP